MEFWNVSVIHMCSKLQKTCHLSLRRSCAKMVKITFMYLSVTWYSKCVSNRDKSNTSNVRRLRVITKYQKQAYANIAPEMEQTKLLPLKKG